MQELITTATYFDKLSSVGILVVVVYLLFQLLKDKKETDNNFTKLVNDIDKNQEMNRVGLDLLKQYIEDRRYFEKYIQENTIKLEQVLKECEKKSGSNA